MTHLNPTPADALVRLANVSVNFGAITALSGINLTVYKGELLSLIGPNGAGKSTLVHVILGALKPHHGTRWLAKNTVMAFVPQKLQLPPSLPLTVLDFLRMECTQLDEIHDITALCECTEILHQQVQHLSGGLLQRVLIARALLRKPQVCIMDEPTQGLDQRSEQKINALIESLPKRFNMAVIVISHDLHWVQHGTDRVICLNKHICCQGHPLDVQAHTAYQTLYGVQRDYYAHHHTHCSHDDDKPSSPSPSCVAL